MTAWRSFAVSTASSTLLFLTLTTCGNDASGGGNGSISNPAVFENTVRRAFLPLIAGIGDGLDRLLVALDGGAADGVIIIPHAGGADATISLDLDGNGSRESSINGSLDGDLGTGAQVTLAGISAPEPSLGGSGTLTATETSPGIVVLDNIGGSGGADPSGHQNAAEVTVTDGTVSLDLETGTPDGSLDLEVSGEGDHLGIHVSFEPDGSGGWRIHFTGNGLDFTIP